MPQEIELWVAADNRPVPTDCPRIEASSRGDQPRAAPGVGEAPGAPGADMGTPPAPAERYARAFQINPQPMSISTLADGRYTDVNEAVLRITSYTREEMIGHTAVELGIWADAADRERLVRELKTKGGVEGFETVFRSKNGATRSVLLSASIVELDGEPCLITASLDVSDRMRAERILGRYHLLSEHARDIILFIRPDGRIVEANDAAVAAYGYDHEALLGLSIYDLRDPATAPAIAGQMVQADAAGILFETSHRRKDGSTFPVEVSSRGAEIQGERLLLSIIRDITERKRLEQTLQQQAEALQAADRRKDEFLAMLAHELRNPLASVRNAAKLLEHLGPEQARLVRAREIIDRQVTHQTRLLDDLLDVSRIVRGMIRLRTEPLDLTRLVHDAVEDNRALLEEAGLALSVELPSEPLRMNGDPTRLAQVVGNLLQNAAKFTNPGGRVTVRLEQDGDRAVLTVRDTGIGVEAELLPRLFEPFTQADRSLDRARGGLGLGLALVRGLTELHGGEVQVESDGASRGTTFRLRLPILDSGFRILDLSDKVKDSGTFGPSALAGNPKSEIQNPKSARVLIVEDNRDAGESLCELLELFGYAAAVAYSGPEALAKVRQSRPDVVLCDLGLPGMDGYQVATALRGDPQTAQLCLIAVSGYGQEEDQRRAREAGFDRHLTKPVDLEELQQLLNTALSR